MWLSGSSDAGFPVRSEEKYRDGLFTQTEANRNEVLATVGASLDVEAKALMEEDLRSSCIWIETFLVR